MAKAVPPTIDAISAASSVADAPATAHQIDEATTARPIRRLAVFCGSNSGQDPAYRHHAQELGHLLGKRNIDLVYGGGDVGLMGLVADAAMTAGADVYGVIPRALEQREVAHKGLTELRVVDTMHERKLTMYELSDAFVAMPGGYGTLDELFETLTWIQLGLHAKPCGLLNVGGYFDPLLQMLDRATEQGFIGRDQRGLLATAADSEQLLQILATMPLLEVQPWIGPDEI